MLRKEVGNAFLTVGADKWKERPKDLALILGVQRVEASTEQRSCRSDVWERTS